MAKRKKDETTGKNESSKDDLQKKWEERINLAKKYRKEWENTFRVKLGRDYFAGKQNPGYAEQDWITVNKIYSHLMAELPGLYSVDPYFYVKTKRSYKPDPEYIAKFEQKGKIRQAYLNYLKGELKLKEKARLGIQDTQFAYGVLKSHYYAEEKENPDAGKPLKSESGKTMYGENKEALIEPDSIPVNERYCISRVHPDDFLWSRDAGTLEDKWPWVAERIRMTRDEAENDKRISKQVLKTLKPPEKDENDKEKPVSDEETKTEGEEVLVFWEIYDLKKKEWLIIAEGGLSPAKEPSPLPKGVSKHPYSILRFTLQDDTAYPIPPVSQMLDPQREICESRSKRMTHRKRFNRKYEVHMAGLTDESEADKLESGEDGTVIRKQSASPVVTPIQDAPLDQQDWMELQHLNNDLIEISGHSGPSRGVADSDSATEASILEKRLDIREGDRLSLVTEWILDAAQKIDFLVQANISRDEAVKITGPQGEFWQLVKVDDYEEIEGEFEYSISVGATTPQLPHLERAQWISFMTLLQNFPQLLLAEHFIKRMAEMHNIDDEVLVQELIMLGKQMMSGALPMPGQKGSEAGVPGALPGAATAGAALGMLGGLVNGGGAAARDGIGG